MSWYGNIEPTRNGNIQVKSATMAQAKSLVQQQGWQDWSTLAQLYEDDPLRTHLKLQTWFGDQKEVHVPSIFEDALKNDAVLETNGWGDTGFSYDVPIESDNRLKTVDDRSYQELAGYDGSTFKIVLNRELAPGTQITCQGLDGENIVVSDAEPVRLIGAGYEHTMVLLTDDPEKSFPAYLLGNDIEYFSLGTNITEYTEEFGKVHMPEATNYHTYEFKLGSAVAVETGYTGRANMTDLSYGTAESKMYFDEVQKFYKKGNEMVIMMDNTPNAPKKYTIGSMLQMLTIQKFNLDMTNYLMFSKGGQVATSKGVVRFNEGLWRQLDRGAYKITYGRRGGITKQHLQAAKNYVFKVNPKPDVETRLMLKAGSEAFQNIIELYRPEVTAQIANIAFLLGHDRLIDNPVSGDLYNLKLRPVRFTDVYLQGIGQVQVIEDRSLNKINVTDRKLAGMNANGYDYTTYSLYIWDVTDRMYSNNMEMPRNTTMIGNNNEANIYLVTPKEDKIYWGTQNGRYSSKSASDIVASSKSMTESFFIYGFGAMWMKDSGKVVVIELEKAARKGYK